MTARFVAAVAALTALPLSANAAFTRGPWIQNAASDTVSVAWEAASSGGTQTINYGLGNATNLTATGTLVSGSLYIATLPGLSAASKYSYSVTSNGDNGTGTFVTAPANGAQNYKFVVYGDNRTNDSDHAAVVSAIIPTAPDFLINTGDLEDEILVNSNYDTFFSIEKALLANTPMFPAEGNHDTANTYSYGFDRINSAGQNWYSFQWGNAFFLCIGADGATDYSAGSAQLTWATAQLQAAKANPTINWIFAYHHYPVYSSDSSHGSTADMAATLDAMYQANGVDVVFNGHAHDYERNEANGIVYIVAGGGGAPLYTEGTALSTSKFFNSTYSFVTVDVNGGTLTLKALDTSGNVLDTRTIIKAIGPPPSPTPTPVSSGTPTPAPTDTPSGNGAMGGTKGCDVSTAGAASGMGGTLLAMMAGLTVLIRRRQRV